MSEVTLADFKKSELRTAKVLEVTEIPGADRLWKLRLDVGPAGEKEIVAGVKAFYTREQLLGKTIVIVANLEPSVIRGVESRGMLLAASQTIPAAEPGGKEQRRLTLLTLDSDLPPGSLVG